MSDWDVLDRQFDAVGQPNDPKSFYKDNALRDLIDNLNERIIALENAFKEVFSLRASREAARATAPVSDDEIVEALAKAEHRMSYDGKREWPPATSTSERLWLDSARKTIDFLRADGYDVVKRS